MGLYQRWKPSLGATLVEVTAVVLMIAGLSVFHSDLPSEFIYFQF